MKKNIKIKINNITFLISWLLIGLISIAGCTDVPYSGPIVTSGDLDQYLNTIEQNTVCLQDGFDAVCVKLLLDRTEIEPRDIDYVPTVHVHSTNIVYVFNYQGRTILEAKRLMDTSPVSYTHLTLPTKRIV